MNNTFTIYQLGFLFTPSDVHVLTIVFEHLNLTNKQWFFTFQTLKTEAKMSFSLNRVEINIKNCEKNITYQWWLFS